MRRLALILSALLLAALGAAAPAYAYSYAAAGAEPLLDGREALFAAASAGNWPAAQTALAAMQPDLDYLEGHEDPGIAGIFSAAMAAQDAKQLEAAFARAASAEVERRINGARDNLADYQTAKVLVVKAQRFYTAIAADLAPDASKAVADGLQRALDAIGNPGVFGVGARKPDPAAFATARADILKALGKAP
ncbi:MAG: hypothetical protein WDM84_09700 [Bauldia sp.]